jgi:predicted enzyme related to lactoylglutathione lyase
MSTTISGFAFNLIYVDDMAKSLAFYEKHFNFKKDFDMDDGSCWGKAGNGSIALWIGHGYKRADMTDKSTRTSIMYSVPSAKAFFQQLKSDNVPTLHSEPQHMGKGDYWFQFTDPAGNILEVLGGE